jgi:DNA-binding transcriptional LysR family regulator
MISNLARLRALIQVAERGTVSAAANALGYTPSAVSQQLAALEAELGVPLRERRGRNVVLTDAGHLVVRHGRDVLAAVERTETAVAELHGEAAGPVRIGALPSAMATLLPTALRHIALHHPRVEPDVVVYPLDDNVRELRIGSLDLAVDQSYGTAPHALFDELDCTLLLEEDLMLLSSVSDPRDSVADTDDCHWVLPPSDSAYGRAIRAITAIHGLAPQVRYQTEDNVATVRLVAAGLAVAVVPALALVDIPVTVHTAPVPDAHRRIYALTRPAGTSRPAVRVVIDELERAAQDTLFPS